MVLKITSQYPRLGVCRAFDASLISDYPEEQEYLIGFIYLKVLEVRTRELILDWNSRNPTNLLSIHLTSTTRAIFFAIQLFGE